MKVLCKKFEQANNTRVDGKLLITLEDAEIIDFADQHECEKNEDFMADELSGSHVKWVRED